MEVLPEEGEVLAKLAVNIRNAARAFRKQNPTIKIAVHHLKDRVVVYREAAANG